MIKRFWAEGRLKLEPWLTSRLDKPSVHRWPHASVAACKEVPGGGIEVELSDGTHLEVDHVVLATGYKPDMREVPYLAGVVDDMDLVDGFPVLDEHFQSSVPGLFVTGFPATRDFGPFFGFVRGCPVAAELTTAGLEEALGRAPCSRTLVLPRSGGFGLSGGWPRSLGRGSPTSRLGIRRTSGGRGRARRRKR